MSLIRTAAILSVVVMLLPTDQARQAQLAATASSTLTKAMTFCDRNGPLCATAADGWAVFVHKAEFGMDLAGRMVREAMASRAPAPASLSDARPAPASRRMVEPVSRQMPQNGEEIAREWSTAVRNRIP